MPIITVPPSLDSRKKTWRKRVTSIDLTASTGHAFIGAWLRAGERAELPAGAFVLTYDEPGSVKNWHPELSLYIVEPDGSLTEALHYQGAVHERSWSLAIRDRVALAMANTSPPEPDTGPLATVPDAVLLAECERRGLLGGAP